MPIPRCVCTIEGDEESGSAHFPFYAKKLKPRLGQVEIVFCLDSLCLSYDALYYTTSLRGATMAELRVKVLEEGVHSGDASGIVPSSFLELFDSFWIE